MRLHLPDNINADGLLPFLSLIGDTRETRDASAIELDFSALRRVSPAALVALSARVTGWTRRRTLVFPHDLEGCPILSYLHHMNLLATCGFTQPNMLVQHGARGRFVPVRFIDHQIDEMGSEMALCVAPGGDEWGHPLSGPYDLVWYILTEISNNVRQHSDGDGFACAQVGMHEGLVRLAIADNGRGIRQSFQEADIPWATGLNDTQAILKALESRISSKGSPNNEGVGLTLTAKMAELASAWMLVVSGKGVVRLNPGSNRPLAGELPSDGDYPGTLVALTFRQNQVRDFAQLLDQAKRSSGLLHPHGNRARFSW